MTYKLETAGEDASNVEVSSGDTLANEEGLVLEVLLVDAGNLVGGSLSSLDVLLVVEGTAGEGSEPSTQVGEETAGGKGNPLEDERVTRCR